MELRNFERIEYLKVLKKHIEEATLTIEGLKDSDETLFTGAKGLEITAAYEKLLDIMHSIKLDIHSDNTISLIYEDAYNGKVKISYEQIYSMRFCYAIMLIYTETTCAIRDVLKFIPKHDWSQDPLYTFQVDFSTTLHVIFS